jgi:hypothetical protein
VHAYIHVHVGGLGQHPSTLKQQAELPRRACARARAFVNHDGVKQPTPSYLLNERRAQRANVVSKLLAESCRALREAFLYQDIERGYRHRAAKRVPDRVCVYV